MDCKSVGTKDGWLCILHTLIHFFPIYQSLACFIEFHGQGDDLALIGLERFGVTLVLALALGSRNAAIVLYLQLQDVDDGWNLPNHTYPASGEHSLYFHPKAQGSEYCAHYQPVTLLHIHARHFLVAVWNIGD